ncbi:hypothetical protein Q8F55_007270 [Vanrija albida]|uniref:Uncharacterized protein n=1 Tax=Vanrija albida TaxID=181172 RepID=A0ABR3PZG4_9TREE
MASIIAAGPAYGLDPPLSIDYFSGIRSSDLESCCTGEFTNLTSFQFSAVTPRGWSLPPAISGSPISRCHIDDPWGEGNGQDTASCMFGTDTWGYDPDMWFGVTISLQNGSVLAETPEVKLTLFNVSGARGASASASDAATATGAASGASTVHASWGIAALMGLVVATAVIAA